jgi:hypothetical protein
VPKSNISYCNLSCNSFFFCSLLDATDVSGNFKSDDQRKVMKIRSESGSVQMVSKLMTPSLHVQIVLFVSGRVKGLKLY